MESELPRVYRRVGRWTPQEGPTRGARQEGRDCGEGGKKKKELKTIYKLSRCHVYLIYVNPYIYIYVYVEGN